MSIKVRAQIHPLKFDCQEYYREAAPLKELYAGLGAPLDITHARFLIDDEIVTDFDRTPSDGSTVYIKIIPAGSPKETGKGAFWGGLGLAVLGGILIATGVGAAIGVSLIGAGVGLALGGVALMNLEIPVPGSQESGKQMDSIRGSKNRDRKLDYAPVLFGRHLVVPDVAALPYTEIDGDGRQWLTQLFCAGYNDMKIEPGSLKIGDTSLIEYSESKDINSITAGNDPRIKLEIIQNGDASAIYPNICVEQQINAVLKKEEEGMPLDITRTTADKTTRINVDILFPQGLTQFNEEGKKGQTSVSVKLQYKPELASESEYQNFPDWPGTVTESTVDSFRRQATVTNLPPGKYTVRIERLTADSQDSKLINSFYLGSIRAYSDERPVRESAARELTIIAIKVRASALATGVIDTFNFVAQSLVPNYNGTGSSAAAWTPMLTKNPASMLLYVLRGKINPDPVSDADIDWDAFREFWLFCNEKKYTCNAIQGGRELFSTLCAKIAKTGRATLLRVDGKFTITIDNERPAPVQLFSPRNTVNYTQRIIKADIPDEIAIEFIDETVGWTPNERSVYNTETGLSDGTESTKQASKLWGITDPETIYKFARYQYACIKNRPVIHTINCDIEYLLCRKGDLVEYAGDTALTGIAYGKVTGLVKDGNNKVTGITSDTVFPQEEGKNYGIRCRKSNGLLITLDVENRNTSDKTIIFDIPQNEGILEAGDLVIFGLTGKITRQLIITEINPENNFQAKLTCIDYAPEIFNVDDPNYIVPPFDNKITTDGSVQDTKIINPDIWPTWFTYHDNEEMPEKPTGTGTTGGWHRYVTLQSRWVSQKTAKEITEGEWSAPEETNIKIINDIAAERPTYKEIVNGFTQEGATMIPAALTVSAAGGFRYISLSWMKQTNLSNLKEYQIQVSEDTATWYAPRFDGQGPTEAPWRGEANEVFSTAATMVIHSNIPPSGSANEPAGRFLFYRVRQRTMLDAYSDWSMAGAETKLTDTGDYGVNSISVNALKTAELLSVFAKLTESLIVDPRYGISSENAEWSDGDTRAVLNARQIAFQYFLERLWMTMARLGLEGVEARQLYSPDKLFITNDDMHSRRARGYDVGAPLLSGNSRVAHFDVHNELSTQEADTWVLDQHGNNFLLLTGTGSLEGEAEGVALILKAIAPYATEARALHGNFRLQGVFDVDGSWTFDFWMYYYWNENQTVFKIGGNNEYVQLAVVNKEPYLNDEDTDGVFLNDEAYEGAWLNEIKDASTAVTHFYQGILNTTEIETLESQCWHHVGIVANGTSLKLLINSKAFSWNSQAQSFPITVDINPTIGNIDQEHSLIMVDEILFDPSAAIDKTLFDKNGALKRPWGHLDDQHPWAIINVKNPEYFRTNIFQSPDFAAAVQSVINGGT